MKKIMLIMAILVLFFSFVSADFIRNYNPSTGEISITIYKGWNIIPQAVVKSESGSQNCYTTTLSNTAFYYSPALQKYVGPGLSMSQSDNYNVWASDAQNMYYSAQHYLGGAWVYAKEDCSYSADLGTANYFNESSIASLKVAKGWNFIAINPWMVGKNWKTILSNCDLVAQNQWNDSTQSWWNSSSTGSASVLSSSEQTIEDISVAKYL